MRITPRSQEPVRHPEKIPEVARQGMLTQCRDDPPVVLGTNPRTTLVGSRPHGRCRVRRLPQPRQFIADLAERWQPQGKEADPVEKVRVEPLSEFHRVDVGRGQESKVALPRSVVAERKVLLFLDRLDEQPLQVTADVADLIEEQRVTIGGCDQTIRVLGGPREGALLVAEELCPHGLRVVLAARDSRPVCVLVLPSERAVESDPTGKCGLPRAALTEQQHRDL